MKKNTKIGSDIKVGKGLPAIGVDYATNTIYVANTDDGTVSVIDGKENKVVSKVMFNIEPFNAGHVAIKSLYDDGKVDEKDMHSLDKLKDDVMDDYAKGKISEQHYNNLNNTISVLYEEIYKKQIDSLNGKNSNGILLNSVKENVKDGYAKIQQLLQQKEVQLRLINKRAAN